MPTLKRINFFASAEGLEIAQALKLMDQDGAYNTTSSYSANTALYPDNLIPFIDRHMNYLNLHPHTNPGHYVANLRLMTRLKS
jgi:hypothetical protein